MQVNLLTYATEKWWSHHFWEKEEYGASPGTRLVSIRFLFAILLQFALEAGSQDSPLDLADTSICTVTGYDCTTENTFDQIKNHTKSIDGGEYIMRYHQYRSSAVNFMNLNLRSRPYRNFNALRVHSLHNSPISWSHRRSQEPRWH